MQNWRNIEMTESNKTNEKQNTEPNNENSNLGKEVSRVSVSTPPMKSGKPNLKVLAGPPPGFQWNPLLKYPPNNPCPCKNGKKYKKCCLRIMPRVVTDALAKLYEEQMAAPDLVFLTDANFEKVKDTIDPEILKVKQAELQKAKNDFLEQKLREATVHAASNPKPTAD